MKVFCRSHAIWFSFCPVIIAWTFKATATTHQAGTSCRAAAVPMATEQDYPDISKRAASQEVIIHHCCYTACDVRNYSYIVFVFVGFDSSKKWDPDRYRAQHSFVFEYGSSLIDLLDPQPGERILDLGCGTGELTHAIADRVGSSGMVVGIDADANMVAAAQSRFPDVTFRHADATSFTLEEPVDAIFSNAALHWVTNAEQAVTSMSRALKPGGRLMVEFGGKGNVKQIVQAAQGVLGSDGNTFHNPWYFPSIAEYTSLLEQHGLEVTSAVLYDRPTVLQGADGIKNWYRMFGKILLKGTRAEEMEDVLQALEEKLKPFLFDGKTWTADYRRIRIVARKLTSDDRCMITQRES